MCALFPDPFLCLYSLLLFFVVFLFFFGAVLAKLCCALCRSRECAVKKKMDGFSINDDNDGQR